jgi:glycosyltransferase involved in cell wall biosynthesis
VATNGPIKIAILLPSMQVGGAEKLVLEELTFLRDDQRFRFEVHLVFEKGQFFNHLLSLNIPIHVWNAPHKSVRMLKTYFDIILHLRRAGCDILHSHLLDTIGPIVGRLAGARVVATVHSDKRYGVKERFVLGRSDLVLCCGKEVLQNIRNFIPLEKMNFLNNAIRKQDVIDYRRQVSLERFGIDENSNILASLGRLHHEKGYDVLIKAFRTVIKDVPNVILLIGGDGEERNSLNELVESKGLGAHVKLLGLISETNDMLESCDVYINSSRCEGLPMTLLEAMAHGKPIVATNVGGNPEVVRNGMTGLLVPPENPEKLAEAIVKMLKDEPLRKNLGNAAFALFNGEYTIDRHCATLANYYLQVMKG